jgi:hypothetical protein
VVTRNLKNQERLTDLGFLGAGLKHQQTPKESLRLPTGHAFEIILPNLIHKSKKRNLK